MSIDLMPVPPWLEDLIDREHTAIRRRRLKWLAAVAGSVLAAALWGPWS